MLFKRYLNKNNPIAYGRGKYLEAINMRKKRLFALGLLAVLVFALAGCGGSATGSTWSGSNSGRNEVREVDKWEVTARSINGYGHRDIEFSAENLATLHANITYTGGSVTMTLSQGSVENVINIPTDFDENIDMSDFGAGRIRVRLDFDNASDVNVNINW